MHNKTYFIGVAVAICFLLVLFISKKETNTETITVSAAASLKDVCDEFQRVYEHQYPGKKLNFNFASSGVLANQILAGAPVDVYLSASVEHMKRLVHTLEPEQIVPVVFAENSLVVVQSNSLKKKYSSLKELSQTSEVIIAIGNPTTVPAGKYSIEALDHMTLNENFKGKLVYAEHVRQVVDYLRRGEVDAGIVYETDLKVLGEQVKIVERIPTMFHSKIRYLGAIIPNQNQTEATMFLNVMKSSTGKNILKRNRFRNVS